VTASPPPASAEPCAVCGGLLVAPLQRGECADCGAAFHLNLRTDRAERSCGAAFVGQQCGLVVLCDRCGALRAGGAGGGGALVRVG
jgi:hypothetical protein